MKEQKEKKERKDGGERMQEKEETKEIEKKKCQLDNFPPYPLPLRLSSFVLSTIYAFGPFSMFFALAQY